MLFLRLVASRPLSAPRAATCNNHQKVRCSTFSLFRWHQYAEPHPQLPRPSSDSSRLGWMAGAVPYDEASWAAPNLAGDLRARWPVRPSRDLAAVPPRSRRRRIQVARCCRACPFYAAVTEQVSTSIAAGHPQIVPTNRAGSNGKLSGVELTGRSGASHKWPASRCAVASSHWSQLARLLSVLRQ